MAPERPRLGGVEGGGTKFRVAVGTGPDDLVTTTIPTTTPDETLGAAIDFLAGHRIDAVGVAAFGPLDLVPDSPTYGFVTTTPKPGWQDTDFKGRLERALGVKVAIDVDVGGAALAEGRWGAGRGCGSLLYLTVGTGIGGALLVDGRVHHGAGHAEMGHVVVEPEPGDPLTGLCPYHGHCLEGLAAGPAVAARREAGFAGDPVDLEARYLAQALQTYTYVLAPHRIVVGGGVTRMPGLLEAVRAALAARLGGYTASPAATGSMTDYVVAPRFGQDAGLIGAIALAADLAGVGRDPA